MCMRLLPLVLSFCLLMSCSGGKSRSGLIAQLQQAEQMLYAYPDSALQLLESLKCMPGQEDSLQAAWGMLLSHARLRCNVSQTDSLCRKSLDYFAHQNDSDHVAQLLYVQGALLQEQRCYEQALKFYLRADSLKGADFNPHIAYHLNMHLSQVYAYQSKLRTSIRYALEAYMAASACQNPEYKLQSHLQIARLYTSVDETTETEDMYRRVIQQAKQQDRPDVLDMACMELAAFYRQKGHLQEALACLNENQDKLQTDQYILETGKIYRLMGVADSALAYLEKAVSSVDSRISYEALEELASMPQAGRKESSRFRRMQWERNDSIYQIDQNHSLASWQQRYREQQEQNQRREMALAKERQMWRSLALAFLLLATFAAVVLFYQRKLYLQKKKTLRQEAEIRSLLLHISENQMAISRNEALITELCGQMEQDNLQHEELQQLTSQLQEQNAVLRMEVVELRKQMHHHTPLLSALQERARYLSQDEWTTLEKEMDLLYDHVTTRLKEQVPSLTDADIQFCCLLKLGLSYAEIGTVLNITPSSVAKKKLRLKAKMAQDSVFTQDIPNVECWLKEL